MSRMLLISQKENGGFRVKPMHGNEYLGIFGQWEREQKFVITESGNRDPAVWRIIWRWAHDHCTPGNPCFVKVVPDHDPGGDYDVEEWSLGVGRFQPGPTEVTVWAEDGPVWDDDGMDRTPADDMWGP